MNTKQEEEQIKITRLGNDMNKATREKAEEIEEEKRIAALPTAEQLVNEVENDTK